MEAAFLAIIIALSIGLTIYGLGSRFSGLKQLYYTGIVAWSQWLPVIASLTFIIVVASNVVGGNYVTMSALSLRKVLTFAELLIMLVISPLLFTRAGGAIALASIFYLLQRLNFGAPTVAGLPWLLSLGSLTVIAVMADRMPWNNMNYSSYIATNAREFTLILIAFSTIGAVVATIIRAPSFIRWSELHFALNLSQGFTAGLLGSIVIGWLCVTVGYARHFILPLVCLPSLFVLAFVTKWPAYILVVPFAATIALSVAYIDRRRSVRI